jgi:vacuolar-type H+-ATPase subunit E/Vma4
LRKADERHKNEIRGFKDEIAHDFERKLEELRDRLVKEKEDALEKEREKSLQKLDDQYQRLESQFNEERKRWKDNMFGE